MRAQKNGQNGSDGNPVIQEEDNYSNEGEDQEQRSPHQDVLDNIDIGHQDTEFDEEIPNFKSFYFDRKCKKKRKKINSGPNSMLNL